jgi:hypothetical protein
VSTQRQRPEGEIALSNVRLSFPKLFEAEKMANDPNSKPRFSANFLISKDDTKNFQPIIDEIRRLEAKHNKGKKLPDNKVPLHDGDAKSHDGYEGHWYLSANRAAKQGRPQLVDRSNGPVAESDGLLQAGDYVDAVCRIYFTDKFGATIACSLEIVRHRKEGERFGGSTASMDALPDLPDEDEDLDI